MQQYMLVLKTLIIASVGGFVGYKLKIPAGAMIGSMLAVAAASLFKVDLGGLPSYSKAIVQVVLGAILGLGLRNMDLQQLKSLLIPAAVITGILLATGFAIAFILNRFFGFDMMTAIFSSTAGRHDRAFHGGHRDGCQLACRCDFAAYKADKHNRPSSAYSQADNEIAARLSPPLPGSPSILQTSTRRPASLKEAGHSFWLGRQDSNLRYRIQSPVPYRLATPQNAKQGDSTTAGWHNKGFLAPGCLL